MNKKLLALYTVLFTLLFSCSGGGDKNGKTDPDSTSSTKEWTEAYLKSDRQTIARDSLQIPDVIDPDNIMNIDYAQDLSKKSLQELRLLRNAIYARHGYLFDQADLRGYFSANTKWYDKLAEDEYFKNETNDAKNGTTPIKLTVEEEQFVAKVQKAENELKQKNYILNNGVKLADVSNIVNLFQFKDLSPDFMKLLDKNNFVIVPGNKQQLFHVYEENDYHQVPNFITTDAFLQLYHMYFSYLLKSIEEDKFVPALSTLSSELFNASVKMASSATDPNVKAIAEYNEVFYAIPYAILTGQKKAVPTKYASMFSSELSNIDKQQDATSDYMEFKDAAFPYSLFKPRGHYTRTETLKKYFKAMMWLQTAVYCREKPTQLLRASLTAWLLNSGKTSNGRAYLEIYNSVFEPICYLMGEPDNISVTDIMDFIRTNSISSVEQLCSTSNQSKLSDHLVNVVKTKNLIKPKLEISCSDKINFMPQRYLPDNKILQNLVDVKPNAERAFPKGLDVFAAMGVHSAEEILYGFYNEPKNWSEYPKAMDKLKKEFTGFDSYDKTVYNKWLQSLMTMQDSSKNYPPFMQTKMWGKKNLNTALASWAELKHDAILYGEEPMGAECGGGGVPPPVTLGYVEPNLKFWQRMMELIDLTENMLKKNNLVTDDIKSKNQRMKENCQFLISAVKKELKGEKLSRQEYETIEVLGSTIEYITLSVIDDHLSNWQYVQGPDKSVAVVADIYTRNIPGCDKQGILHEAVGNVNDIYVVVEIDGYLYLTKGATFSYYEFVEPMGTRLTDEEWQQQLQNGTAHDIPEWMKDIILQNSKPPAVDEKVFYSSGC